jgi:nucleoside-diphosphate-sugar epimerase
VAGLRDRGHQVTIFHRGRHEIPELDDLEHLHGDPFSRESIAETIGSRRFDLAIASYGRVRLLAEGLVGHCDRLVTISGAPVYAGYLRASAEGRLLPAPVSESEPLVERDPGDLVYPAHLIRETERIALDKHAEGAYAATIIRYPILYGPRTPHPWEWLVVRRILDQRPFIMLPDGGLSIHSRSATANAAHCVLAAIDAGELAAGNVYNVADDRQYSIHQWVDSICQIMGASLELVSVPGVVPSPGWSFLPFGYPMVSPHVMLDNQQAVRDLGYADLVHPLKALQETVEWLVDNADAVKMTSNIPDRFDYPAEDRMYDAYGRAMTELAEIGQDFDTAASYKTPQSGSASD